MEVLGVRLGFGFSAGLFDYLLNFNISTRPLWLLPVGAAYFAVYYAMFRFFITRFDLPTPGREPTPSENQTPASIDDRVPDRIPAIVGALGGAANLVSVDACTTRLRLLVNNENLVRIDRLKELGAHGVIRPTANAVQVVVGPAADQVASAIRTYIGGGRSDSAGNAATYASVPTGRTLPLDLPQHWITAFGGPDNLRKVESLAGRLRIEVLDRNKVDGTRLQALGLRALVWVSPSVAHLLLPKRDV
jgi:PTS system N-acetylglucosamine-specific IIC component